MEICMATFTVIDVETTGLSPAMGDRVCEVGAVKIKDGKIVGSFESLVNPRRPVSPGAYAQHRISDDMLKDAPDFTVIAQELFAFMSGTVLVAQNAQFDLDFLNSEFPRVGFPVWNGYVLDTIALARRAKPGLPSYNLDSLSKAFGVTITDRHRALGDVEATAEVLLKCVDILQQSSAARSLEDLLTIGKPWKKTWR